jgi:hypothetical protein
MSEADICQRQPGQYRNGDLLKPLSLGSTDTSEVFDNLYYRIDERWFPLPPWAKFYLELGNLLSQFDEKNRRFIAALAVPTRPYVSALISTGLILARSRLFFGDSDHEYYEKIIALEEGAPLIYRDGNRKKSAKKVDNQIYNGKLHIGIQVDEGTTNTRKYLRPENARLVEITDKDVGRLPQQQMGREIASPSELVRRILGETQLYDFVYQTRLESIILGPVNDLTYELETSLASSRTTQGDSPGSLSDLMRVREFHPPGTAYRCSILAAANEGNLKATNETSAFAVLFDGSLGFVKWRDHWRQFNWVVILDRTDPNFDYAVDQVNNEYAHRSELQVQWKVPQIPAGIEMMFFANDL